MAHYQNSIRYQTKTMHDCAVLHTFVNPIL